MERAVVSRKLTDDFGGVARHVANRHLQIHTGMAFSVDEIAHLAVCVSGLDSPCFCKPAKKRVFRLSLAVVVEAIDDIDAEKLFLELLDRGEIAPLVEQAHGLTPEYSCE